ncbi:MAG: RNA methyltransferase [Prevotella sp.]|nr:RNA methyltransferase [Prevotella sp.]
MISKNQIKFVKQLEQKKYRQREGLFVAEGPKVVGDLLAAGFEPVMLFATDEWKPFSSLSVETGYCLITPDELRKLSFLQHPQQVLAVFPIKTPSEAIEPTALILALDGVQDPGNLGTIIRIADWFGIDTIVCSNDTADCWNPKVVQATMGSIARVNICYTDLHYFLATSKLPVCGTLLDGDDIYQLQLPTQAIIVMGNEGNGISPSIRQLVTHKLLIPQFRPGAESLNVAIATAIVCSEFRRPR